MASTHHTFALHAGSLSERLMAETSGNVQNALPAAAKPIEQSWRDSLGACKVSRLPRSKSTALLLLNNKTQFLDRFVFGNVHVGRPIRPDRDWKVRKERDALLCLIRNEGPSRNNSTSRSDFHNYKRRTIPLKMLLRSIQLGIPSAKSGAAGLSSFQGALEEDWPQEGVAAIDCTRT